MHHKRTDRLAVTVVILAAGALSFSELYHLGVAVSWPPALAWLLPVAIDLYALVATRLWLGTPAGPERRKASRNALAAIVLSVAGNALEHLAQAHVLAIGWEAVVIVSAIPPAVMALTVHLAAELSGPAETVAEVPESAPAHLERKAESAPAPLERKAETEGARKAESAPVPLERKAESVPVSAGPAAAAETETVQVSPRIPAAESAGGTWKAWAESEKVAAVLSVVEQAERDGVPVTGNLIGARLGITDRTGRTYLRKAEESRSAAPLRLLS